MDSCHQSTPGPSQRGVKDKLKCVPRVQTLGPPASVGGSVYQSRGAGHARNWHCACAPGLLGPPRSCLPPALRSITEATATGPPTSWHISHRDQTTHLTIRWPTDDTRSSSDDIRLPSDNIRSPSGGSRSPSEGFRSPSDDSRSCSDGFRSPPDDTRSTPDGLRSPSDEFRCHSDSFRRPADVIECSSIASSHSPDNRPSFSQFNVFPLALLSLIEFETSKIDCWDLQFSNNELSCELSWLSPSSPVLAQTSSQSPVSTPGDTGYFSTPPPTPAVTNDFSSSFSPPPSPVFSIPFIIPPPPEFLPLSTHTTSTHSVSSVHLPPPKRSAAAATNLNDPNPVSIASTPPPASLNIMVNESSGSVMVEDSTESTNKINAIHANTEFLAEFVDDAPQFDDEWDNRDFEDPSTFPDDVTDVIY